MNGIQLVLRALHHGESHLAEELTTAAERHRADHEVHHVAIDLAQWSREHLRRLADTGRDHDLSLDEPPRDTACTACTAWIPAPAPGPLPALKEKAAEALGHRPEPGLLLLRDLRDLHLGAARNALHWECSRRPRRPRRPPGTTTSSPWPPRATLGPCGRCAGPTP